MKTFSFQLLCAVGFCTAKLARWLSACDVMRLSSIGNGRFWGRMQYKSIESPLNLI
jgi:hypothetical protein